MIYRNLIMWLERDSRIDKESLNMKTKKIDRIKSKIFKKPQNEKEYKESIKDIESELNRVEILLRNENISNLQFTETPDIIIKLNTNIQYGIEVKRIQAKPEDVEDLKKIMNEFTNYGKPRTDIYGVDIERSQYVKDYILEKMSKSYKTEKTILFIDSHSYLQIESSEIEEGIIKAVNMRKGKIPFEAIMYKTKFVDIDEIEKTDIVFLNNKFYNSKLFSSLKRTNNFIIKYLFNNQVIKKN
jgi:hypothetical protein